MSRTNFCVCVGVRCHRNTKLNEAANLIWCASRWSIWFAATWRVCVCVVHVSTTHAAGNRDRRSNDAEELRQSRKPTATVQIHWNGNFIFGKTITKSSLPFRWFYCFLSRSANTVRLLWLTQNPIGQKESEIDCRRPIPSHNHTQHDRWCSKRIYHII